MFWSGMQGFLLTSGQCLKFIAPPPPEIDVANDIIKFRTYFKPMDANFKLVKFNLLARSGIFMSII